MSARHQDRERAKLAYACVGLVPKDHALKYRQLVRGVPAEVQSCGVAQTIAFHRAKAGRKANEHAAVVDHIVKGLKGRIKATEGGAALLELVQMSPSDYRRATVETLAFLQWLKRIAEAEIAE